MRRWGISRRVWNCEIQSGVSWPMILGNIQYNIISSYSRDFLLQSNIYLNRHKNDDDELDIFGPVECCTSFEHLPWIDMVPQGLIWYIFLLLVHMKYILNHNKSLQWSDINPKHLLSDHLVNGEVNPCIRNDTKNVGNISAIHCSESFLLIYFHSTVKHSFVLARLSNGKSSFYNLKYWIALFGEIIIYQRPHPHPSFKGDPFNRNPFFNPCAAGDAYMCQLFHCL